MAGTPEEDLLAWLEREEENLGFTTLQNALGDFESAHDLFIEMLGYDLQESQFQALNDAVKVRYVDFPLAGIQTTKDEHMWGFQTSYRIKGRFASFDQVQEAVRLAKTGQS